MSRTNNLELLPANRLETRTHSIRVNRPLSSLPSHYYLVPSAFFLRALALKVLFFSLESLGQVLVHLLAIWNPRILERFGCSRILLITVRKSLAQLDLLLPLAQRRGSPRIDQLGQFAIFVGFREEQPNTNATQRAQNWRC